MFAYWNADKIHEKELCNVIYIVATVFVWMIFHVWMARVHMRNISEQPFQENKVCL